jgi:hypothetical protein
MLGRSLLKASPLNRAVRTTCEALESRTMLAGLDIVPTFAPSITNDPKAATIEATINAAIQVYEGWISTPITVNITYGETTSGLANSSTSLVSPAITYTALRSALAARATTPDAVAAVASLPVQTNNPVNGTPNIQIKTAQARALGMSANVSSDASISINTSICNLTRNSIDPAKYDLMAVIQHETDEALGFGSVMDLQANGAPASTTLVETDDLFRYNQNGARSFDTLAATQAFYSLDGGKTSIAQFNQSSPSSNTADFADWSSPSFPTPQVQDAAGTPGATPNLGVELRRLNVMGYGLNFAAIIGNQLQVSDYFGQGSTIVISQSGSNIVVQDGSAQQSFPVASMSSIVVHGNDGSDIIRVEGNAGLPTVVYGDAGDDAFDFAFTSHNLGNISGPTTVNGGSGTNSLFVYDNANSTNIAYTVNANGMSRSGWGGFTYGTAIRYASLTTGTGNNPVSVISTNANQSVFLYSAGGADAVTVGGTGTAQGILGNVEIHNSPNFTSLTVDDTNDFGSRDIVIDNSGSLGVLSGITGPIGGTISWANSDLSNLTVNISQFGSGTVAVRAMSRPLTLHNVTVGNQGSNYAVSVGNNTNGMQSILGNLTLIAAFGQNQSLTFDDAADTVGRATSVSRSSLNGDYFVSGLAQPGVLITFRDYGSLLVRQGSGADSFTAGGTSQGGYDNDLPMTVNGNGGNDTYTLTSFNNWGEGLGGTFTFPVMLDGGAGFNQLSINDAARANTGYQFYANRFYSREPTGFPVGADFNYDNMGAIGLTCSNGNNSLAVYSTSSDIVSGNQISVALNGGSDTVTMYPHDAQGNLTINGTIGIGSGGGAGTDTMIFDDTGSPNPINYSFSNPFGASTQDVFGIGAAGMGYTSDFDLASIKGGNGNDTFSVNQYTSNVPLAIYGGPGDDTLNLGGNNLPANIIMPSGSFLFDGQDGTDHFNLNNMNEISQWTYTAGVNVEANRGAPVGGYDVLFTGAHNEEITVNAGPAADTFYVPGTLAGTHLILNGRGGVDVFQPGSAQIIQTLIRSKVTFDAGSVAQFGTLGGGNVLITAASSTPIKVHVDATMIGARPDDTLFAPGGSVEYLNATSVSLTLGSGADTVYAQPNLTAPISITGGTPTSAPGDTLNLALAAAQNYVLHGSAASGNVTSSNLKTLSYSGFETGPTVDDVAPAFVNADINLNGFPGGGAAQGGRRTRTPTNQQSVDVSFSEDVSSLISAGSIELTNLTTGQAVPNANIAESYDTATNTAHFTFPGYSNGVLPDGNYHGRVFAGLPDYFGNALPADAPFDFFFLNGDANHDRTVDVSDLGILATNWQTSGKLFSEGDFNYDGMVDVSDLGILATNWQQTLSPPAGSGARQPKLLKPVPFETALAQVGLRTSSPSRLPRLVSVMPELEMS